MKLLLNYGSKVNEADKYQFTPLHFAAQYADDDITQLLIDNNAQIEATDKVKFILPIFLLEF